ncbi:protamine [Amyelois transitella]|uniref:protamine n=1 Tax=Amyelois transitella TaxID=680683 RepID=UPI002990780A|nr:protamine [Amyelois transitella]
MGGSGGMEPEEKKKQLNDDVVVFLSKTDPPRYNARLHAYVDLQRKRSRAAAARRRSELFRECRANVPKKNDKNENQNKEVTDKGNEEETKRRRGGDNEGGFFKPWRSNSNASEPSDRCRRRKRCGRRRRRRRRSCRRRRRRRRSCRRRRRRSRSRRRRRRSCRRRRRRSRRKKCRC